MTRENGGRNCCVALVPIIECDNQTGCKPDSRLQPSQQLTQWGDVEESPEEADILLEFPGAEGKWVVPVGIVDSVKDNDNCFVPTQ